MIERTLMNILRRSTPSQESKSQIVHGPHRLAQDTLLPVEIVLSPAWWHHHEGIDFDEDFFFHPAKRVEAEQKMEQVLHERWGRFGLGKDHDKRLPLVGAVHLAAGFLLSEMLGCAVEYVGNGPPLVRPADHDKLDLSPEAAFRSPAYRRWESLCNALRKKYGGLVGDVNWSGILNLALDIRGENLFFDMMDRPDEVVRFFDGIATVIEQFTQTMFQMTGSTSISVNRMVRCIPWPVHLHSECSLVMISLADYERFLMPFDVQWSMGPCPFGIHYCGKDPHRFGEAFSRLPRLDFLDVGWGGDVARLRSALPNTFLNLRYGPVEIARQTPDQICQTVRRLVQASGDPWRTGVCCINMDHQVKDEQITALFEAVESLRAEYRKLSPGDVMLMPLAPHR